MNVVSLPSYQPVSSAQPHLAGWRSLLTHTHMLQGELNEPDNKNNLVAWMRERQIDAIGVGSPFTPQTRERYFKYDGEMRDLYYQRDFDSQSEKFADDVEKLIRDLNTASHHNPYFYLDNETPKARYGHMWWVGWWHDFPDWHDYDQPFDRWMCHQQQPGDRGPEPMPYERRPYMEIVASQRQHGALGMWAHPTSWWRTGNGAFVTNIASEMPAHLVADGFIDGLVIMGYDAYRPSYLALWFHLLDLGYEVLGVAETDVGLSSMKLWDMDPLLLTCFKVTESPLETGAIVRALASSNVYATSGPLLLLDVDGKPMGSRLMSCPGQPHHVTLYASSGQPGERLGRLELLTRKGEVLWSINDPAEGTYSLVVSGISDPSYLVARAFGKNDIPGTKPDNQIHRFAITNPVYLRPPAWKAHGALTTEVNLSVSGDSRFCGGRVIFEDAAGHVLEEAPLRAGDKLRVDIPASGRMQFLDQQKASVCHYLINANPAVMELQRYLYRGKFLADYPDTRIGDVPHQAFQINTFRDALSSLSLKI
jgi:hypothetical protein